jgi:hypothetical protein
VKKPKPYCSKTLTEAAFRSRLINALRRVSMHWKPKSEAMKRALGGRKENPETGNLKQFYICEETGKEGWQTDMHADHKEPVVPEQWGNTTRFLGYNWNEYLQRMFVEADGYQIILKTAHKKKTNKENKNRKKEL